jgi:hypothetical protein
METMPPTLHKTVVFWNEADKVEIVEANDSPGYYLQSYI